MTEDPEITVRKVGFLVPTTIVGSDEQGRTLVICPDCLDTAYVAEDGRIVCPLGEAQARFIEQALGLMAEQPERRPDWLGP